MPTPLRTLILEDRVEDVELMLVELRQAGFAPDCQHVDTEADYLAHLRQDLDVILADYSLPQFDASRALKLLQDLEFDIPFIVVTGSVSEEAAVECMKLGAADYLLKDRLARLGPAVTQALEAKRLRDAKRQADEQVRRRNQELTLLNTGIEQTADGVIITDTEGLIRYVNPAFEQITGYSRAEAIGKSMRMLESDKHDESFYAEVWSALRSGKTWRGRFVNRRKDRTLYTADASITPVRDESGHIVNYVEVQRDVTHELQLEERYLQAQKMEAIGRLAGGIAHDFNNLLTAIKGYTGLLLGNLESDDQALLRGRETMRGDLDEIERAADRAAGLVRQLLTFSRRQVVQFQVLDLNWVVANIEKMIRRLIGEDIELAISLDPALGLIRADPGQIEQVIMNLVVNARDAMPCGGKLLLETANVVLDEAYARGHADALPGMHALLTVSDTGMGMDEHVRSHLFEPFFTTKEPGKGTGLGLATVHGIVMQSGGHIHVHSEPGAGTTFRVYLPQVAAASDSAELQGAPEPFPRGTETVLLVEDEDMVRNLASRVLRQQGYTVLAANHPDEALRLCAQHVGPIHLLITDVVMPVMGGRALATRLASARPGMHVLYISGYADEAIAQHGVLGPEVAFLQKPFTPQLLAQKARRALDEHQPGI